MRDRLKRRCLAVAAGAVLFPCVSALAGNQGMPAPSELNLGRYFDAVAGTSRAGGQDASPAVEARQPAQPARAERPLFLADGGAAPEPEKPNIHGFFSSPFKTAYITPRGLVVENEGLVWQPVGGLIIPIGDFGVVKNVAVIGGIWNSVNTAQEDTNVGPWNEMDVFVSVSGDIDKFNLTLTYGAWNFPQSTVNKPSTEHNIDLKVAYDDTAFWGDSGFALKPYVDFFYAVSGSSTVVLGEQGDTGYVEIGIAPTYTLKAIENYPVTFTFPVYFSVGPEDYWDATEQDGNFGVFSASVNASVPLAFIPTRYGFWHADFGVTYFNLLNGSLFDAGNILSGNDQRNVFVGSVGIGFNF